MEKTALFAPRLMEADLVLVDVGTVRVRGLSRFEAVHVQAAKEGAGRERRILALGMVEPRITEEDAGEWMKAATAGEIEKVTNRITELSGLASESAKDAYKSDGDGPGE